MAKYKREDIEDEADDKSYSEELAAQTPANDDNEPTRGAEEATYQKRYGDLRRHTQQQAQSHQREIDELKQQLEAASKQQIKFPKTDEEIDAWAKKYPDVAAIIDTIAQKRVKEATETAEKRLKGLQEFEDKLTRREAEQELLKLHPDFGEIRGDKAFHEWAETQPKWVQDALYVNNTDPYSCARAIDLYKADMGIGKGRKPEADPKDAARAVGKTRSSAPSADGKAKWSESRVAALSNDDYEKHEDDIAAAIRSGKFDYDISGGAR